jgi:hypothetical protein
MVEAEIFQPRTKEIWSIGYNLLLTKFAGTMLSGAIEFNVLKTRALISDTLPDPHESESWGAERVLLYRLKNIAVSIHYRPAGQNLMFDRPDYPLAKIVAQLSD